MKDLRKFASTLFLLCLLSLRTSAQYSLGDGLPASLVPEKSTVSNVRDTIFSYPIRYTYLSGHRADSQNRQSIMLSLPGTHPKAFFCRLEWQAEKVNKLPLTFKLGDTEQVNKIEGKVPLWQQMR